MLMHEHTVILTILLTLLLPLHSLSISTHHYHHLNRRLLHHPLILPPLATTPSPSPTSLTHHNHHPTHPFSTSTPTLTTPNTTPTTPTQTPFFPTDPTLSPPPPLPQPSLPPPSSPLPTFPANISSLALPSTHSPSSHTSPLSLKLTLLITLLSLLSLSLLLTLCFLLKNKHHNTTKQDPPSKITPQPKPNPKTSSEFLYLGTLSHNDHHNTIEHPQTQSSPSSPPPMYLKLCGGSPELKPLPPLPKQHPSSGFEEKNNIKLSFDNDEEFFSPKGFRRSYDRRDDREEENYGLNSCETSEDGRSSVDSDVSVEIRELAAKKTEVVKTEHFPVTGKVAPPAPPPPPVGSGKGIGGGFIGPPPLVPPSGVTGFRRSGERPRSGGIGGGGGERVEEVVNGIGKTKLKALHWDKVRASSDRVMVWDQLHPGSFQLNEEMIETLFKANGPNMGTKDGARRSIMPLLNEETRVLDPKKSQNIAILLKALNVTVEEVCEALVEGNADTLGSELLESLQKMAPTVEEERKLKAYRDESPMKLGPAEQFLKAVLDVPFAFKRVDALLYMATFDSEVEYLKRSIETLEAACKELRNSRMFLKLLEAVLKTGNRMNVGTNRGDAEAFKLDTLLKLADVKGTDGKTTLLHFVVQEIIKAEGSRFSLTNPKPTSATTYDQKPAIHDDMESRKRGLEVVSGLGSELMNVKKAAAIDSDGLGADVTKLARGIMRVNEILQLVNKDQKELGISKTNQRFSEAMNNFLQKAEAEIVRIQSQESCAFNRVKELTEYFDGNLAKEEAHPLRIFTIVRDLLCVLDKVCKEVGKANERTIMSSARPSTVSANRILQPPFPELSKARGDNSSDDESVAIS